MNKENRVLTLAAGMMGAAVVMMMMSVLRVNEMEDKMIEAQVNESMCYEAYSQLEMENNVMYMLEDAVQELIMDLEEGHNEQE